MLQAEIAGRTTPSADGYPSKGHTIRDFCMCSSEGQEILLSRYRGHSNMVLVFAGASDSAAELLSELRRHQRDLAENETRVLALVAGSQQRASELKHALHRFRSASGCGWKRSSFRGSGTMVGTYAFCRICDGSVRRGICCLQSWPREEFARR